MPTAYLKKLAKLNKVSVNKLEKFWAQAKEIAKSEGQGKSWGLITTIFQNRLKKEGFKVKAFKEEFRKSDSGQIFKFQKLSLASIQKLLKYYLEDNEFDSETHWNDLYDDSDGIVYIEYNDNKTFYSVTNPLLKNLKTTNIRNCIIEYPSYTVYFGKDCRIEKFDSSDDAPYVIKCMYEPDTLDSTTKNKLDYIKQVKECIKKIWARGTRNQQEFYAKDWTARYSRIVDDCLNAFEEPKVCARMMYIKYHKENPSTRDLNKNHDTDFYTLLKEAKQYFEGIKKWKEELLNKLNKQVTASMRNNMKCNLDKNSMDLLKSIGFEFRRSHDNDGETLDAYRTAKGKYEWIMCLGKKEATEGYQYRYFVYKNRYDMLIGRKAIKDVDFKNKKELLDYFKLKATASAEKVFAYKGQIITASSKKDAIEKIVAYTFGNRTVEDVREYLKHYSPIEKEASNLSLYKKEIIRLLKADGQVRMLADKYKLNCLCKLCYEAKVSCYDAFRYISNNF